MYEVIDNFLSEEDFISIQSTFFPQDLSNSNKFTWTYQKGIVRNPDLGPTGYEEHDWIYVHSLYSTDDGLRFDKYYPIVKSIIDKYYIDDKKMCDKYSEVTLRHNNCSDSVSKRSFSIVLKFQNHI